MYALKALVAVKLKSYIAILAPSKHKKKNPYSSGAKLIFVSFIATVHIHKHCSLELK